MPTDGRTIYRDTSTTPTKGISLDDIGECLNMGTRDLGSLCQGLPGKNYETDLSEQGVSGTEYCNLPDYRGTINCGSKAKPIWFTGSNSILGPDATSAQKAVRQRGNPKGWEGTPNGSDGRKNPYNNNLAFDMVYGIEIPTGKQLYGTSSGSGTFLSSSGEFQFSGTYADLQSDGGWLGALLTDGHQIILTKVYALRWRYEPPMSDITQLPFRVLDFDGYNHYAVNPMPTMVRDKVIGVTFTKSGDTVNRIDIPIVASLTSQVEGGISFDELDVAIKARGALSQPSVGTPQSNPFAEGFMEYSGGDYVATTDTTIQSGKTYYISKGLSDFYLCALIYYTEWGGGDEEDVVFKQCLWASSDVKKKDDADNWNKISFRIERTGITTGNPYVIHESLNLNTLKDLLTIIPGDDGVNGLKQWRIKFFWCSSKIGKRISGTDYITANSEPLDTNYLLVRGNDSDIGGTPISFVDRQSSSLKPTVSITARLSVVENQEDGTVSYYVTFSLSNPNLHDTNQRYFTFKEVRVNGYMYDSDSSQGPADCSDSSNAIDLTPNSIKNSNYQVRVNEGEDYTIDVAFPDVLANEVFTDFLCYVRYGNTEKEVCGVIVRTNGEEIEFYEDSQLNRWYDPTPDSNINYYSADYAKVPDY